MGTNNDFSSRKTADIHWELYRTVMYDRDITSKQYNEFRLSRDEEFLELIKDVDFSAIDLSVLNADQLNRTNIWKLIWNISLDRLEILITKCGLKLNELSDDSKAYVVQRFSEHGSRFETLEVLSKHGFSLSGVEDKINESTKYELSQNVYKLDALTKYGFDSNKFYDSAALYVIRDIPYEKLKNIVSKGYDFGNVDLGNLDYSSHHSIITRIPEDRLQFLFDNGLDFSGVKISVTGSELCDLIRKDDPSKKSGYSTAPVSEKKLEIFKIAFSKAIEYWSAESDVFRDKCLKNPLLTKHGIIGSSEFEDSTVIECGIHSNQEHCNSELSGLVNESN